MSDTGGGGGCVPVREVPDVPDVREMWGRDDCDCREDGYCAMDGVAGIANGDASLKTHVSMYVCICGICGDGAAGAAGAANGDDEE